MELAHESMDTKIKMFSEPVFPKLHKIPSIIHDLKCEDGNTCCSISAQLVTGCERKYLLTVRTVLPSYHQSNTYSKLIFKNYSPSHVKSIKSSCNKSQENNYTKI